MMGGASLNPHKKRSCPHRPLQALSQTKFSSASVNATRRRDGLSPPTLGFDTAGYHNCSSQAPPVGSDSFALNGCEVLIQQVTTTARLVLPWNGCDEVLSCPHRPSLRSHRCPGEQTVKQVGRGLSAVAPEALLISLLSHLVGQLLETRPVDRRRRADVHLLARLEKSEQVLLR